MVALQSLVHVDKRIWLTYLGLSLCVNGMIAYSVNIGRVPDIIMHVPTFKVSLMSLAAPAPEPVKKVETKTISLPPPEPVVVEKKIVTVKEAPQKIAIAEPIEDQKAKPVAVARPVQKPVPEIMQEPVVDVPKPQEPEEVSKEKPKPIEVVSRPSGAVPSQEKTTSSVVHEATYRHQTPPSYPRRAFELGQQGTVTLHAEVLPNGHPRELLVAETSGHRLLDLSAVAAVRHWRFEPTNINGNAIISWVRVPVSFIIK